MLKDEFYAEHLEWYERMKALRSDAERMQAIEDENPDTEGQMQAFAKWRRMQLMDVIQDCKVTEKDKQARKAARWFNTVAKG